MGLAFEEKPAHAGDFSTASGLNDIQFIKRLDNGNIFALDSSGKAAVFDYLNWTIINSGPGFEFSRLLFDASSNCIVGSRISGSNEATPYKYEIANNAWYQAGPALTCPFFSPVFFSRNGEIYAGGSSSTYSSGYFQLFKLVSNNWMLISTGPFSSENIDGFDCGYDAYSGIAVMSSKRSYKHYYAKYNFATGSWTSSTSYGSSYYSYYYPSISIFKNVLALMYKRDSGGDAYTIAINSTSYALSTGVIPRVFATGEFLSGEYDSGAYINDGYSTINVNFGYPLNVACYDKYGNIVLAGPNGRVVIRDKSGTVQTDTSFYTEFVVHDVKTLSEEASDAAKAAKESADLAANRTIYNGQSAAYWAYQASQNAANSIVPAIQSVRGQNGATCTTGTTFTVNVAVSPSTNITYTVTGVPGYSVSGNTITLTGLTTSGAYNALITATYAPSGKTCTYPFTFFKV